MSSIPIVPDSDRISTATLSASVGPVTVGFPVFGGADDLSVFLDGALIDPSDWTLTSITGKNPATDILPAGDGRVTFDAPQTGDVQIIGEIKPARTSQFPTGVGIGAETQNLSFSKIWAAIREIYCWGKAAIKLAPGDRAAALPGAAARAGKVLSFSDPGGNPEASISVGDIANAAGYASSAATAANNAQQAEAFIIALMDAADFTYFDSGVPNDAFGSNGDVYVNTAHARWSVYGPKAGGAWGSIVGYMFGEDGVGTGDVSAASNFNTDNRVIRSDGTAKGVQSSGITVDDSNNVSGVNTLTLPNAGLKLLDTNASHGLIISPGSDLTADRTLTITTGDAARTLTISANTTLAGPASTTVAGPIEIATAAEFRTATDTTRALGVAEVWAAAAEVTLTDAATIAVDFASFINGVVTLAGNRAMGNPTNEKVQSGYIRIKQDATGSRTLSFGTDWEFAGGTVPTLSTAANAEDLLFYQIVATDRIVANLVKDVK